MSLHAGPEGRGPTVRPSKPASQHGSTTARTENRSWAPTLACLALVVATCAAYSDTLRYPFFFDDKVDVLGNRSIRHLWPLGPVFLNETQDGTALRGRPVVNLSLAINYATGALDPFHYHVTNLAIHALAGLTLFGVVRRTLGSPMLAPSRPEPFMPINRQHGSMPDQVRRQPKDGNRQ